MSSPKHGKNSIWRKEQPLQKTFWLWLIGAPLLYNVVGQLLIPRIASNNIDAITLSDIIKLWAYLHLAGIFLLLFIKIVLWIKNHFPQHEAKYQAETWKSAFLNFLILTAITSAITLLLVF